MKTIESRVRRIVIEQLDIKEEELRNNMSFIDGLGADSLDTFELMLALEDEFKTKIPDDKAEKITTVQQAINYIKATLKPCPA